MFERLVAFSPLVSAQLYHPPPPPGEIDGYDITIQNCRNADIYLLDLTSQVQIDDCENCRFFIAPCSGPVFIRNCKSIRVAVVTSQLRLRDCTDAHLMVYVRGRSAIESCKRISLCCWNVGYFQLPLLMARSGLSVFDNGWRRFDDFGTHSAPHFLPMATTLDDLMRFPKVEARAGLTPPSPGLDPEADSTASVNNNDHISNVPWRTLAEVAPDCFGQESEEGLLNPVARVTGEKEAEELVFALFSPRCGSAAMALLSLVAVWFTCTCLAPPPPIRALQLPSTPHLTPTTNKQGTPTLTVCASREFGPVPKASVETYVLLV